MKKNLLKKGLSLVIALAMLLVVFIPCFTVTAEEEMVKRGVDFAASKWVSNARVLSFNDVQNGTQMNVGDNDDCWLANGYLSTPVDLSQEFSFTFSLDEYANQGRFAFRLSKTAEFVNWNESSCYDAGGFNLGGTYYTEGYLQSYGGAFRHCGATGDFTFTITKGSDAWVVSMSRGGVLFEEITIPFTNFAADFFTENKAYLYIYNLNMGSDGAYHNGKITINSMTNYVKYTAPTIDIEVDDSASKWVSNARVLSFTDSENGTQMNVGNNDDCWLANGYLSTPVDLSENFSLTFSLDEYANQGRFAFRLSKTAEFVNWNDGSCYDAGGFNMGGTYYTEGYLQSYGGAFRQCGATGDFTFTVTKGLDAWVISMYRGGVLFESMTVPFTALAADFFTNNKAYLYIYNLNIGADSAYHNGQITIKNITNTVKYSIPKVLHEVDDCASKWVSNARVLSFTDSENGTQMNVGNNDDCWLANGYLNTPVDLSQEFSLTFSLDEYANQGRFAFRLSKTAEFVNWNDGSCYDAGGFNLGGTYYTEGYLQSYGGAFRQCGATGDFTFTVTKGLDAWVISMSRGGVLFESMTVPFTALAADFFANNKAYLYIYNLNIGADSAYHNGQITIKSVTDYADKTADIIDFSAENNSESETTVLKFTIDDYFVGEYTAIESANADLVPATLISTVNNKLLINGKTIAAMNEASDAQITCNLENNAGKQQLVIKLPYEVTNDATLVGDIFTFEVLNGATGSEGMAITTATYFCKESCTTEFNAATLTWMRKELLHSRFNSSLDINGDSEFDVRDLVRARKLAVE